MAEHAVTGWTSTAAEGSSIPAGSGHLGAWNDVVILLPKGNTKKWTLSAAKLSGLLSPSAVESAEGSMNCVVESNVDNRLMVKFDGVIKGKGKDGSEVTFTVKLGRAVFDSVTRKPISLDLNGSVESVRKVFDKDIRPNQFKVDFREVGEIRITSRKLLVSFSFN